MREDSNLRGRTPGESAELVKQGIEKGMAEAGARCTTVKIVLDEQDAALDGMHVRSRATWSCCAATTSPPSTASVMADAREHGVLAIADPGELAVEEG